MSERPVTRSVSPRCIALDTGYPPWRPARTCPRQCDPASERAIAGYRPLSRHRMAARAIIAGKTVEDA
ncbi:hypothetical protein D6851_03710 [Altericroceibacterium spongiae]|uniref:Uncharacterized protein n=1 Tax=Altericroceibacterium spongiae TaxID=2320269 RepID=A0A420ENR4_9SPHN|nr:hypothetical protein D6851_03710 [Altericroceibacterium spongiae]